MYGDGYRPRCKLLFCKEVIILANCYRELTYRCYNDCEMNGCPGHKATLEFQSCSNAYHFNINGKDLYFEQGALQALIDLIKALNRYDTVKF